MHTALWAPCSRALRAACRACAGVPTCRHPGTSPGSRHLTLLRQGLLSGCRGGSTITFPPKHDHKLN